MYKSFSSRFASWPFFRHSAMNGIIFKEFKISVLYGVGTLINMELKRKSQPDADE
jgi:hypothetical protein